VARSHRTYDCIDVTVEQQTNLLVRRSGRYANRGYVLDFISEISGSIYCSDDNERATFFARG